VILPDVNILVFAYRRESDHHDEYHRWLQTVLTGPEDLALVDHCLTGFLRIVTNPRIYVDPAPATEAAVFVDQLRLSPRARPVAATSATWELLNDWIASDHGIRGNLFPDAYLAALAVSHGCRLATADRGFARFEHLEFFDPIRFAEPDGGNRGRR
jgi:hypothetical protein